MNNEVKKFLSDYYSGMKSYKITDEEDIIYCLEDEKTIYEEFVSSFRWWDTYNIVVELETETGSRYFCFEEVRTTGDCPPSDLGYEQNFSVWEVKSKVEVKVIYVPLEEK